jgi:hypothetical protein
MDLINYSQVNLAVKDYLNNKEVNAVKLNLFVALLNKRLTNATKYVKRNVIDKVYLKFAIPLEITVTEREIIEQLFKKHMYEHVSIDISTVSLNWFPQDRDLVPKTFWPLISSTEIEITLFYQ